MKELLVKDYRILLTQKKSIIFILIIGIIMVCTTFEIDFMVGYMMMMAMILSAGTINYDELDKGMAFIMTLPASRKNYAVEKYLLTFINTLICGVLIFAVYLITGRFVDWGYNVSDMAIATVGWICGIMLSSAVLLPLYMKFGAEKRRVIIFILWGVVAVVLFAVQNLVKNVKIMEEVQQGLMVLNNIGNISPILLTFGIVCIMLLAMVFSMFISIKIMQKKEF